MSTDDRDPRDPRDPKDETSTEEPADASASGGEGRPSEADPREELFEAIDHFKKAANALFDRASKDPTIKSATSEAERVIQKLGATAEPLARQLTGELSRLTKRISEQVSETTGGRRKSETPPPDDDTK